MSNPTNQILIPPSNWAPRAHQVEAWRQCEADCKRMYLVHHRRSGKDEIGLLRTAKSAHQRVGNYLYLLPEHEHVRRAIWESVDPTTGRRRLETAFPQSICHRWKDQDMVIPLRVGSHIRFAGSDNYNAFMGGNYVGVVFSEWALADPLAWAYLKPILEANGGWAMFLTTPRGENHAKTMWDHAQTWPGWYCSMVTAAMSGIFSPLQLDGIKQEYVALWGEDEGGGLYAQEMFCDWRTPIPGAFYALQLRAMRLETPPRIGRVPYDRRFPVDTAWDIGYGDATAIWFIQRVGGEVRCIDYLEDRRKDIPEYATRLKSKPYLYKTHYMPPDADARLLAGRGVSVKEQFEALQIGTIDIGVSVSSAQQIQAVRALLGVTWIDESHCTRGLSALQHYHAKYRTHDKEYAPNPVHDWSSHAATAFATYALAWQPPPPKSTSWYRTQEAAAGQEAGWMR